MLLPRGFLLVDIFIAGCRRCILQWFPDCQCHFRGSFNSQLENFANKDFGKLPRVCPSGGDSA